MDYTFNRVLEGDLDEVVERVVGRLSDHGFGVLMDLDIRATMKKKLERDMLGYRILGACHPASAWDALHVEPRIGVMLPCNVVVRELGEGRIEVAAVDPVAAMSVVESDGLGEVADLVRRRLQDVVDEL